MHTIHMSIRFPGENCLISFASFKTTVEMNMAVSTFA